MSEIFRTTDDWRFLSPDAKPQPIAVKVLAAEIDCQLVHAGCPRESLESARREVAKAMRIAGHTQVAHGVDYLLSVLAHRRHNATVAAIFSDDEAR